MGVCLLMSIFTPLSLFTQIHPITNFLLFFFFFFFFFVLSEEAKGVLICLFCFS